jgi:hypothetical protein
MGATEGREGCCGLRSRWSVDACCGWVDGARRVLQLMQ